MSSASFKLDLYFTTPIKQLIFVITDTSDEFNFLDIESARLMFGENSNEKMQLFSADYFSMIQDYYHNLCIPYDENIYSYSFALNSSLSEMNGSVHFGQLKSKILEIHRNAPKRINVHVYGRGYNIFRTHDGYGTVEFKI